MPPAQCPECGRFLKRSFVTDLAEAPAPCPGCGTELQATMFAAEDPAAENPSNEAPMADGLPGADGGPPPTDAPGADAAPALGQGSVRPPDLSPQTVRDDTSDVLAGWDPGVGPDEVAAWRGDQRPFPLDAAIVLGAGAAGLLAGWAVGRNARVRGVVAGAVAGVVAAAVARRVWRLED